MADQSKYGQRGVSATKDEVHAAIKNLDKGLYPNAFCKILPDMAAGSPEHCTLMHADTAGTKGSLAYIYWKETGDLSVWEGIAHYWIDNLAPFYSRMKVLGIEHKEDKEEEVFL